MASDRSARLAFILSLTDKVSAPLGKVKTTFSDLASKTEGNIKQMGLGLGGLVGAGAAITQSLQPALEMNRSIGDVRALGVAEDALASLNAKALAFSVQYGASATEFVASARSIDGAIKGLVGGQLAAVTNVSAVLAKATKSDAETTSSYLGTMYNLFKGQADRMGKVEWAEQLGGQTALAVKLFRTDGAQLKDAFKEVGAIATTAGVSVAEQMAVIGTLSSTMEGGDAGGRYKAFFENLGAAAEKTGLSFTDASGKALPIMQILDKLQGKFGDLTSAAAGTKLTEAFGGEGAQVIAALAKDSDRLRNGLEQIGKVRGLENAEAMAKAMVDPWEQFGAAVQALRIAFGQALIPMLSPLMDRLVGIASTLTRWTQLFPNITRVIGLVTLAILGLIAGLSAMTIINGVIGMLSVLASTTALVVIGIGALAAGVVLGILYWDRLKASFGDTAWFQALITVVTPAVLLFRVFGALLNVFWVGLQQIYSFGMKVVDWLVQLVGATASVGTVWDAFMWALTNVSPFALIGQALKGLIELLNKIPGINIDTTFGDVPQMPELLPTLAPVAVPPQLPRLGPELPQMATPLALTRQLPSLVTAPSPGEQSEQARQQASATVASISPTRPTAVPQGGLLRSIQNTTNTNNSGKSIQVESLTIQNDKPLTQLELENMIALGVG